MTIWIWALAALWVALGVGAVMSLMVVGARADRQVETGGQAPGGNDWWARDLN